MHRFVCLLIAALLFSVTPLEAYEADIEYVSARDYFDTALREINQAEKSVQVFMYLVSFRSEKRTSKIAELLDALIAAKKRGVEVDVYLDQNIKFGGETHSIGGKNREAVQYLRDNGINPHLDDKYIISHSKVIVIDEKTVLMGSSNWSKYAFNRNNEADILVRSERFAKEVLKDLSQDEVTESALNDGTIIRLPLIFATKENLMGDMVTSNDERSFDLALWLIKEYDGNQEGRVTADYDALAQSLGIDNMTREAYRRQISKVLRKLQDIYKLIEAKIEFNENAQVVLKSMDDPTKTYAIPNEDYISIPQGYWDYDWNQKLSFSGKTMYLINLIYSSAEGAGTTWRVSTNELKNRHHVSEKFSSNGRQELRRLNLLGWCL